MKNSIVKMALLGFLCIFQLTARAEDIDLFAGATGSTAVPNLLMVFDNAANFSSNASGGSTCIIGGVATALSGTVGGVEQCALYAAISGLDVSSTAKVNIGIMMYKASNVVNYLDVACTGANNAGGCLVYPLTPITNTSRPALLAWIKSWKTTGGSGPGYVKANNEATGAAMQEAWAYLAGKTGLSGTNYASIAPSAGCLKNFVVFIGNSYSSSGTPGDSTGSSGPKDALEGSNPTSGMNASPASTTPQRVAIGVSSTDTVTTCGTASISTDSVHENKGFYADEWSRYMLSQSMTTYTIGVLGASCQAEYAWLLGSMARNGGGKYFPTTDYAGLELAFNTILSEVQSVNTVFAAVSLPVSVNTQGTYLNQVYMGMFRPDSDSLPRWAGNLKQYKMGYIGGQLRLQDADSAAAISSSGSNFVAECGRSFWTPALSATDSYWNLFQTANCTGQSARSNTPDGNIVEKGGQGYRLRAGTPSARTVKTCSPTFASCTSASPGLTDFNTSNTALTDALLGSSGTSDTATSVTRANLINWARGQNVKTLPSNDEPATVAATAMRPSAHGDVVHSRPVAINFGTDLAPKVMVFYGGNDGVLRAINGNREDKSSSVIGTYAAGDEMWAFVPPEFYGNLKRIYQNTDKISTPNITGTPKSYGMDGTVTALRTSSGDAWVYATMRRGGRALYAFKVDGSTLDISLKWKVGCGDSGTTNCSTSSINNIGQTWATPSIIKSAGYGSGASPMLVVGGGYDATCEDAGTYSCSTSKGTQIYVMDADTGSILRTFSTSRPVVGDVKFTRDTSGMATYGYTADLGGNVYRISGLTAGDAIGSTAPGSWTITRIAALGCATVTTCTAPPNRKFIYGPDIVVEGAYNILLLGSGDREKPLMTANATSNYFFMIKDEPSNASFLSSENGNCFSNVLCLNSLLSVTSGTLPTAAQLANKKGWYFALAANEQVVTSAVTVYGTSYFSTHQPITPVAGSCTANLGNTRSYGIAYATAANPDGTTADPFTLLTSGGLPPSPVAGYVKLDDGTTVPFIIGVAGPLESKALPPPAGAVSKAKIRTYWFRPK
jgi:type IV pilus assembly protein PilY1